ncbi:MAG: cytochrome b/b6 domain-containing protein [Pseudomonadota bacterium]
MSQKVWDLPTRLSHWVLAGAVLTCWWSGDNGEMDIHLVSGYVVLGTILFRLLWGLVGSTTARFTSFPVSPRRIAGYLPRLFSGQAYAFPGHNPAGALMVFFMLAYFGTQATLGLFTTDEILVDGPLVAHASSGWVGTASDWHHELGEWVLYIVGLHVLAVLVYLGVKRLDLITPMITGRSRVDAFDEPHDPRWASPWLGLVLMAACAAVVTALVQWGRGAF